MSYAKKRALNGLFLIAAAAGFAAIAAADGPHSEQLFFAPTALVLAYAFLVGMLLADCNEPNVADHHMDSIYFLGFLFTLVSLIVLFYRLQDAVGDLGGAVQLEQAFYFLGIAVSTSIAGVLLRNLACGAYLKNHDESRDALEKNYELLKALADTFVADYRETFELIRTFLEERRENSELLAGREREYREALERFVEVTGRFSGSLEAARGELAARLEDFSAAARRHAEQFERLNGLGAEIASAAERIREHAAALPLEPVNGELERFGTGVTELNTVLESLIEILDRKVGRIR